MREGWFDRLFGVTGRRTTEERYCGKGPRGSTNVTEVRKRRLETECPSYKRVSPHRKVTPA